jgi:hypothetical protein
MHNLQLPFTKTATNHAFCLFLKHSNTRLENGYDHLCPKNYWNPDGARFRICTWDSYRHSNHCTGGWVDPRAVLGGCGKSRPRWDLILRLSQSVVNCYTDHTTVSSIHNENGTEFKMLMNFHTAKKFIMKHQHLAKYRCQERDGQLLEPVFFLTEELVWGHAATCIVMSET